jgi:peptide/nickel transport system substrate-binding protein
VKKFAVILSLVLALLVAPAAVLAQDEAPVNGGTLRAAWQARWESLDPHIASSEASFQVLNNVLETLTTFDDEINLIPGLAETWSVSEDGLTWTFNLVQDATFSNGRPFTAEDVVWSWQRLIDPAIASGNSWRLGTGAVIEAVDDYTVTITTEAPQATLPATVASLSTGIMASESVTKRGWSRHRSAPARL